uniref:Odorranain-BLP-5 n=1 Tax=Odorrana grahami TaxID=167935 RepID=A3E330_ODOGR|nr:odorranain-BLP-5 [Odorrana grahami]ABI24028.1 odorranain-BLP-5 [Odorrana grahami]ABI24030.1 odorranain-BLP-5 [Odorrana grahami]ABI24031.1 odorranain-BLP-5 [Odorrana grahami]
MTAVPAIRILPVGFLGILLLFSVISRSVCVEFMEDAGKLDKIDAFRREAQNTYRAPQWAVGHLMGKKSLQED